MAKPNLLYWFAGDAPNMWKTHENESWKSITALIKVFESLMRGFAQVCFANNPWSGVLVLIALIIANPLVGAGSLVASFAALIMSKFLNQPDSLVVSGLQNYSAVLVGSVTLSLFPIFFTDPLNYGVWGGIILMGAFSVCVGLGLGVLLAPYKLPVYTLPFNVTTSLLFISFSTAGFSAPTSSDSEAVLNVTINEELKWNKVMEGVLKSSGQVYAVEDSISSILILVALLINSPLLTVASFCGGLLSSLVGLLISTAPYSAVYAGIWGYNGFLAAGCIIFFVTPSITSILLAVLNAVFAAFIQASLIPVFSANNLPIFTFPFCLTSLMFLALIESIPGVERVQELTFPEEHFWKHKELKKHMQNENRRSSPRNDSL